MILEFYQYVLILSIWYIKYSFCQQWHASEPLEKIVRNHGYPLEVFDVTTEDDYVLSVYRIPYGRDGYDSRKNKSVVLIVHGMGGLPHHFVLLGPGKSLAYYLVDRGFEVWIFCTRGTMCSNKRLHKHYNWDRDPQYWVYSWHHIGVHDIPATIDFIISKTNQSKVFLIGHSSGTTDYFAMCSDRPEYNDKIKIAVSYATSVVIKEMELPFVKYIASLVDILKGVYTTLGFTEGAPMAQHFTVLAKKACRDPQYINICIKALSVVGTYRSALMEEDLVPIIVANLSPRIAARQVFHFLEIIKEGQFRKYNLGTKNNLKVYGQKNPPLYNLSNCVAPTAFFHAKKDRLCRKEDAHATQAQLPNVIFDYEVPFDLFNHLDFLFAKNASKLVYEPTYQLFKTYDEGKLHRRKASTENSVT